ncbi:MAG: four helix bundle protein [Candidatus Firestonebacteria bacterium]
MKYISFEQMPVWKESIYAARVIYGITCCGFWEKEYSLKDQIRRAAYSISSNIAEGFEYDNTKDFVRFLRIAKGSAGEAESQLYLARKLGFIGEKEFNEGIVVLQSLCKQLGGFIKYLKQNNEKKNAK